MNYYFACGMAIATEIDFPELKKLERIEKVDLNISFRSRLQHILKDVHVFRENVYFSSSEQLIFIEGVASYYLSQGEEVIIFPESGASEKRIRYMFLSVVIVAVLHQRNLAPLHASAIDIADGVVLFMGESGTGKSTAITALQKRGYSVFSDDICVPVHTSEGLRFFAGYPVIKLCEDAFEKLGIGTVNEENRLEREGVIKYGRYFKETFTLTSRPVKKIYILEKDKTVNALQFKKVEGIEAFELLRVHSLFWSDFELAHVRRSVFEVCTELSNNSKIIRVKRPVSGNTIQNFLELVENGIN